MTQFKMFICGVSIYTLFSFSCPLGKVQNYQIQESKTCLLDVLFINNHTATANSVRLMDNDETYVVAFIGPNDDHTFTITTNGTNIYFTVRFTSGNAGHLVLKDDNTVLDCVAVTSGFGIYDLTIVSPSCLGSYTLTYNAGSC